MIVVIWSDLAYIEFLICVDFGLCDIPFLLISVAGSGAAEWFGPSLHRIRIVICDN